MDVKPTKRGGGTAAAVFVGVVVLLPLLYVLSIGPVIWLQVTGRIGESSALEVAYRPVYWTVDNVPVVGRAINTYMGWWVQRRRVPD